MLPGLAFICSFIVLIYRYSNVSVMDEQVGLCPKVSQRVRSIKMILSTLIRLNDVPLTLI